jgi:hypothetical protein
MKTNDKSVTIQLHRSDFNDLNWEKFKHSTYWYDVVFVGHRIIRIITWESNYSEIQEMYNFR